MPEGQNIYSTLACRGKISNDNECKARVIHFHFSLRAQHEGSNVSNMGTDLKVGLKLYCAS